VAVTLIRIYFGCFRANAKCNQRWDNAVMERSGGFFITPDAFSGALWKEE
jgi:hypothetical protein